MTDRFFLSTTSSPHSSPCEPEPPPPTPSPSFLPPTSADGCSQLGFRACPSIDRPEMGAERRAGGQYSGDETTLPITPKRI